MPTTAARFMMMAARRVLLQEDHAGEEDYALHDHTDHEDVIHESTTDVRIIAIFMILLGGLLGGIVPLFIKVFRDANHPATLLLRSLAAGIILSLALIHVIPDGAGDLEGLYDGPLAPCMVFAGIFMMAVSENLWHHFASQRAEKRGQAATPGTPWTPDGSASDSKGDDKADDTAVAAEYPDNGAEHKVSTANSGPTPAVSAYFFELGCIVHSFLIGFTLGVTVDDRATAVTLTIALVFHQLLEAIGLSTVIVKARFSMLHSIIMISTYALTVPVGIAVGMGVASSYDGESTTALTVQGILNSISGGLLLYIALVQMIAQDFAHMTGGLLVRLGMYFMIALGATCMILIAVFGEGGDHAH